jgi:peptidoglycan/LPS O-acetylase OafA/YrhL
MRQHANAFDLIRLTAAGMVLWSHQHGLMGVPESGVDLFRESAGGVGVLIFFVVSGYLNTLSAIRRHSASSFLAGRAVRIYPALIVCVGFTVLLGACVAPNLGTYLDFKLLSFIGKGITLFTGVKAGVSHPVFAGNAIPNALNGSLWTLPYEVKMYVILAICFVALRYNNVAALVVSACGLLAIGFSALDLFWLHFSAMFMAGSFVAAVQKVKNLFVAILAVLLIAGLFAVIGRQLFACYMVLAAAAISLGCARLPSWLRPRLDLSYAIYLYAFPIQQISAMLTKNFWAGLVFSAIVTGVLALLSAVFVEGPALRWLRGTGEARQTFVLAVGKAGTEGVETI